MTAVASLAFVNCSSDDDKGGSRDCFDCNLMGVNTEYCHTEGDDFYVMTVSIAGQSQSENVPLDGASWSDVKEGLELICN